MARNGQHPYQEGGDGKRPSIFDDDFILPAEDQTDSPYRSGAVSSRPQKRQKRGRGAAATTRTEYRRASSPEHGAQQRPERRKKKKQRRHHSLRARILLSLLLILLVGVGSLGIYLG